MSQKWEFLDGCSNNIRNRLKRIFCSANIRLCLQLQANAQVGLKYILTSITKCRCQSRLEHKLSWLRFVVFFLSTEKKTKLLSLIRPRSLIWGSFSIHHSFSTHHSPLQTYKSDSLMASLHKPRIYKKNSKPMRSFCEYAPETSSGRQNYSCVVHNSNVSAVGLATGPTWRLPPPTLIPVLIGHVSRQSTERSITDVSSRCGEGSEPR